MPRGWYVFATILNGGVALLCAGVYLREPERDMVAVAFLINLVFAGLNAAMLMRRTGRP